MTQSATDGRASGASKPHLVALDGLRGVAALCVVVFHFTEGICNRSPWGICHGFLAVDFFFCLSGFVLGYAYDDRVAGMGIWAFLKTRLIRLHPMVLFGAVFGLSALSLSSFRSSVDLRPGTVALTFLTSALLIPYSIAHGKQNDLFLLNAPSWSLFWEYAANLVFGVACYRVRRHFLVLLAVLSAGLLCFAGHLAGNLSGGWNAASFPVGGVRVAFSFCAGLLIYRMRWQRQSRIGFVGLSLLLMLAFFMPYAPGGWVREVFVITLYFPVLVALGAGTMVSLRTAKFCRLSGDLSYPLYLTHYPVVRLWGAYVDQHRLASWSLGVSILMGVSFTLAFSWLVFTLYDQPVRAYLRRWTFAAGV